MCGVTHNAWYRGSQEGITISELNRVLPLRAKFSPKMFAHIVLQSYLQTAASEKQSGKDVAVRARKRKLPKTALCRMLSSIRAWIAGLRAADRAHTVWRNYAQTHSYSDDEIAAKRSFIDRFASKVAPTMLWGHWVQHWRLLQSRTRGGRGARSRFRFRPRRTGTRLRKSQGRKTEFPAVISRCH